MIIGIVASIIGMVVLIGVLFVSFSPEFGTRPEGQRLERIKKSENYSEGKFQNLTETDVSGNINYAGTLREYFTDGSKVPDWSLPVIKQQPQNLNATPDSITKVTWFGHSAIFLEMDGLKIFIDPMLGSVPAPHPMLGSKRFNEMLPVSLSQIPALDAVLISHDHYDHLDYGTIKVLKGRVAHFYVPLGLGAHLESWGVPAHKISEMDWWEERVLGDIQLTAAPARHFSGRGITDRFKTQWCSWVLKGSKHAIYFSGDSGFESHFKTIGKKYGPFDLSILECGQYDEQWPLIHMMPEETVQAGIDLNSKLFMPIHWGSFKLALHDWQDPIERVTKEASRQSVAITTPIIGEQVILGTPPPESEWWKQ